MAISPTEIGFRTALAYLQLMADYRKRFAVKPGEKIRLKKYDADETGKYHSAEQAQPDLDKYLNKISELQGLLYAEHKHSLLIVVQGLDAAGKDGVIKHVFSEVNPQGCTVATFKEPTTEERNHDFLWRIHPHAPRKGHIAIFNRSHYEDVLIVRVHHLAEKEILARRYDRINDFEKLLVTENNTTILKFFLHISKDEQISRFRERLEEPSTRWKISDSDYTERAYWDDYIEAFEVAFQKTSTRHAPWFIIPSDNKWFRNLAISQIISETLEDLDLQSPAPSVDIAKIKKLYYAELAKKPKRKKSK